MGFVRPKEGIELVADGPCSDLFKEQIFLPAFAAGAFRQAAFGPIQPLLFPKGAIGPWLRLIRNQ